MTTPQIFISYARSDGETFAADLRKRIQDEGLECWRDRDEMMGGRGWWNQITEALDNVAFMVLVATPAALASPVVAKEWRYARQQGVCVYPVQIPGLPPDFNKLPRWMRDSHFYDLTKEWDTFLNHLKSPCPAERVPFMPPDLPDEFVQREREFDGLLTLLLDTDRQNPVAITAALRGAGGFGKTTLATALCHDENVQTAFDDGVLWITLGENPDVLGGLTKLYTALTGQQPGFVDVEDGATRLAEKLADKDCLIVIDDAWNNAHVRPFLRGGERCARLITTRLVEVAVGAKAKSITVDEMTSEQAVELLTADLDQPPTDKAPFAALAKRLGEWPLMLELARSMIGERLEQNDTLPRAVEWVNRTLDKRGVEGIKRDDPDQRKASAGGTIEATFDVLPDHERAALRKRYAQLAIFPEDVDIPLSALMTLWGVDDFDAEDIAARLGKLSLWKFDAGGGTGRLHDVIRLYLEERLSDSDKAALHTRLISAWKLDGDRPPAALPDDYAWRYYAYHLTHAGRLDTLQTLLIHYPWLAAKLDATDITALMSDYDNLLADRAYNLIHWALRLSAHILSDDKSQLPGQLIGRLLNLTDEHPVIAGLVASVKSTFPPNQPALFPRFANLTPPGGALLRTLTGHSDLVSSIVYSPDGLRLASASYDGTINLWDSAAGVLLATLDGHSARVMSVAYSPDGLRLASASDDGALKLWDVLRGMLLATLEGHSASVMSVVYSPNGLWLASASDDGTLKLWDAASGALLATLEGHSHCVRSVAYSPDGLRLASASYDGTINLWDSAAGVLLATLDGYSARVNSVAYSPDGLRLASASDDKTVKVWDAASGGVLATLEGHSNSVMSVAYSPDGLRLASASVDGTVKLWDALGGTLLATLDGHSHWVIAVAYSPDGLQLASASVDTTIKVWDALGGTLLATLDDHSHWVTSVAYSPDGLRLASASADGTLKVWDAASAALLATLAGHSYSVNSVAYSPDGLRLASASVDGTLKVWDAASAALLATLEGHSAGVRSVTYSPDGLRLASASSDGTMKVWDTASGVLLATLKGRSAWVRSAAYSPNGLRLASASYDQTIQLWDTASGMLLATLEGHSGGVLSVAYSPDGLRLASASDDRTVKVWDAVTGDCLTTFSGDHPFNCCAWSGRSIAAGDSVGRIHFFDVAGL